MKKQKISIVLSINDKWRKNKSEWTKSKTNK